MFLRAFAVAATLFCLQLSYGYPLSADIAFVYREGESPTARLQTELASRFYGVKLNVFSVNGQKPDSDVLKVLTQNDTLGVIVTADALPFLSKPAILSALSRARSESVPLMIVSITGDTNMSLVKDWSGGAVTACRSTPGLLPQRSLAIADTKNLARELAGQFFPFSGEPVCGLALDETREPEVIAQITDGRHAADVFMRTRLGRQEIFLESQIRNAERRESRGSKDLLKIFPLIAPIFIFVRFASGDSAWHSVRNYANLTIDDPWLIEPYGNLNYAGLLKQMEEANFHTTIAFIPWNFDRSRPDVVALFRNHPDRFSICVHGNNHDHQEFYDYKSVPLSEQIANIKQALARMDRFRALTGLPYDRVMTWPYEVVPPLPTLAALKTYNFLAHVETEIIPFGEKQPADPLFILRAGYLSRGDLPSLKRLAVSTSFLQSRIALDAFLGNPVLLYSHEDLFKSGMGAFNPFAAIVNHIQPNTVWASLGDVAAHLYFVRLRGDGDEDVLAYSSEITLDNVESRAVTFYAEKAESFVPSIRSVTVDGQSSSYERAPGYLRFKVTVPPSRSSHIVISYENDLNIAAVDVSKPSLRINFLRMASDFRDLRMSRSPLGRAFIDFYNRNLSSVEFAVEEYARTAVVLLLAAMVILFIFAGRLLTKKSQVG